MRKLIITADDFGLTRGVNEAIEQAHLAGILSTASLMVAGEAADDAIACARRLLNLRVGLHLVLVDGHSVLPHRAIPSLVDMTGRFREGQVQLGLKYFFSWKARRQLAAEIRAQFDAFQQTGLVLDHVNAHKHMHLHPTVARLLIRIGRDYGLRCVRVPAEPPALLKAIGCRASTGDRLLYLWSRVLRRQARIAGLFVNDYVFGIVLSGHMTSMHVSRALSYLPDGLTEMYFHPATRRDDVLDRSMASYEHEAEAAALVDPQIQKAIVKADFRLTNWTCEATESERAS
jgi:hopanoid biosynthesis associated protein HpnK